MNTVTQSQRKFLLVLPAIILPFLCVVFYTLGGGKGAEKETATGPGLNLELPKAKLDPKKTIMDKLASYEKASHDSMVRQKYQQQDPYSSATRSTTEVSPSFRDLRDAQADELQQRLNRLQQSLDQPAQPIRQRQGRLLPPQRNTAPASDPQPAKPDRLL